MSRILLLLALILGVTPLASATGLDVDLDRVSYGDEVTLEFNLNEGTSSSAVVHLLLGSNVGPTPTEAGFLPVGGDVRTVLSLPATSPRLQRSFGIERLPGALIGKRFVLAFLIEENGGITATSNAVVATFFADEVRFEIPVFPAAFGFAPRATGTADTLHAVEMIGDEGWAVGIPPRLPVPGQRNTVLFTVNRGASWQPVEVDRFRSVDLTAIEFVNRNQGFLGGNYLGRGTVYRTSNAGLDWTPVTVGHPVRDLAFVDGQNGWAVGNDGSYDDLQPISRTRDGGQTFEPQALGAIVDLWAVTALDEDTALAAGRTLADRAVMLRTTNGGTSWEPVDLPQPARRWILGLGHTGGANPTVFAVGARGTVYRSFDRGATFELAPSGTGQDLRTVRFKNELAGWIVGDAGTLLATADGGETWIPFASGLDRPVNDQIILDILPTAGTHAVAVGHEGILIEFGRLEE